MNKPIDNLLFDSLMAKDEPAPELNRQIVRRWSKERREMNNNIRRRTVAVASICILLAGSVTAYAAYHFLNPGQIAERVNNSALQRAFQSEGAIEINETQQNNGYSITLLGLVSGEDLEPCVPSEKRGAIERKKTYAAFAIEGENGSKIKGGNLCISALISGMDFSEFNNANMNGSLTWFEEDGVLYELYTCDNLEIFADRGVYLGVVDQFGDEARAFQMDSESEAYHRVETYDGTNALFKLPLNRSLGNQQAAEQYVKDIKNSENEQETESVEIPYFDGLQTFLDSLTPENIDQYFVLNKDSVLTAVADETGWIEFGSYYDKELGDEMNGPSGLINYMMEEGETFRIQSYGISDHDISTLQISVIYRNEDGSYTSAKYNAREDIGKYLK